MLITYYIQSFLKLRMMERIRQGMEDIKNGDYITLKEFEQRYEKWLKEKF